MRTSTAVALTCAAAILTAASATAQPATSTEPRAYMALMADCATLDACLKALEPAVPDQDDGGVWPDADKVRERLLQFGDPAKQQLFQRLEGPHAGWRNLAGYLLGDWPSLTAEDVPALGRALRQHPNGWPARALGLIGTDEAIDALIADFKDDDGQTAYGLRRIGPRILPRLTPLLADPERYRGTMSIIQQMGEPAAVAAPGWAEVALDRGQSKSSRIGALRGLEALETNSRAVAPRLHPLLNDPDSEIVTAAFNALRVARDPVVVPMLAEGCRGFVEPRAIAPTAWFCLHEISDFGLNGRSAAAAVRAYLNSPNTEEQAAAASALGFIGDSEAAPLLERALLSRDWRVAFAAARSLGWLGALQARPALVELAQSHWLPEVRRQAEQSVAALDGPSGRTPPPGPSSQRPFMGEGQITFVPDASDLERHPCPGNRWAWNGRAVEPVGPDARAPEPFLRYSDGTLLAIDNGEWGGTLTWRPRVGKPVTLVEDNASGIARAGPGAVAAFGLAHMGLNYGYLMRVERSGGSGWRAVDIGTLPGSPSPVVSVGDHLFGVVSQERLVVFDDQHIIGVGDCAR